MVVDRKWTWTIIYRLYFHPLAKYPGPFFHKISILPSLYYAWLGTRHLVYDELHKKYGKLARRRKLWSEVH